MPCPIDRPLEKAIERFSRVDVDLAASVLPGAVIYRMVLSEPRPDLPNILSAYLFGDTLRGSVTTKL